MSDYWLGVLTIPALVVMAGLIWLLMELLISPPSWTEQWCYMCDRHVYRADHPRRPAWVWRVVRWWEHDRTESPEHRHLRMAWKAGGWEGLAAAREMGAADD